MAKETNSCGKHLKSGLGGTTGIPGDTTQPKKIITHSHEAARATL